MAQHVPGVLPGGATIRATAFSPPISRFPTAGHLYSATGLAPTSYQSLQHQPPRRHQPAGACPSTATP